MISRGFNVQFIACLLSDCCLSSGSSTGTAAIESGRRRLAARHTGGAIAAVGPRRDSAVDYAAVIASCAANASCHSVTANERILATTAIFLCLGLRSTSWSYAFRSVSSERSRDHTA